MINETDSSVNPDRTRYGGFCNQCGRWHKIGVSYSCGIDIRSVLIEHGVHFDGYHLPIKKSAARVDLTGSRLTCQGCREATNVITLYQKNGSMDLWLCSWCEGRVERGLTNA